MYKRFFIKRLKLIIQTATLRENDHGLNENKLKNCNVLIWWGHKAHEEVSEKTVDLVQRRVLEGMGLIVLVFRTSLKKNI